MKINGITPVIKTLRSMQKTLETQIDELDWGKPDADVEDEELNQAWNSLAVAIDEIESILEI